ncbi:molybdopterin molybdotransferase MoeA [Sphingomonas jaspsi]|uniref:molybdopterin molybdotransferase MoeA n=1 Tax=Sphingomonas jaspsi TaxID=392409 RepID=UPI0004B41807|nr:molybdopterin molybdotransferase MoeA [Sphingomonas jaspsi]
MIAFDEAVAILKARAGTLDIEEVGLNQALGRVLAEDVIATHRQPPDPRSMMDGVAIASDGAEPGQVYHIVGTIHAGDDADALTLDDGAAIRVATGAVVPGRARTIVPLENYRIDGDRLTIVERSPGGRFMRRAGADFDMGERLLDAGSLLTPAALALAAAANRASLRVRRRARVAIVASGNELVEPGQPMSAGRTIDSATPMITALCSQWNGDALPSVRLGDDAVAIETAIERLSEQSDLIVAIGGASVGERDHLRPAARALGYELVFEKVRVQPGKPCWFAARGSQMILGLPGNPASAFVCAHLFLNALLTAMTGGGRDASPLSGRLIGGALSSGNRRLFARAKAWVEGGQLFASAFADQDSGLQKVLGWSNALIEVPEDSEVGEGDEVAIHLTGELG